MRLPVRVLFFEHTSDCLTNPLLDAFRVTVDRAMRVETDVGSQSADTIKLNFIRCGPLGLTCGGSASLVACTQD